MTFLKYLLSSTVIGVVLTAPAAKAGEESAAHQIHYVTFSSLHKTPVPIGGRFIFPSNVQKGAKVPAVVVYHGSGGAMQRGELYQNALADAGIASLALDAWTGRKIKSHKDRPQTVMETLPDAFGARKWLMAQPGIQGNNIGIMGFSWGGVVSMLSSTKAYKEQNSHDGGGFKAANPVYPVCWVYNAVPGYTFKQLTGIPMQIITGSEDAYNMDADTCPNLINSLDEGARKKISVQVLQGAHHSFDSPGENRIVVDTYAHRGKGGPVPLRYNASATQQSLKLTVDFFSKALKN
ncbi:MAG: dienelactone hydrolase family protein [Sneathiellales bacterium]|nr:dienelactone hydrolase family protein [Sneathiellales bacterium]